MIRPDPQDIYETRTGRNANKMEWNQKDFDDSDDRRMLEHVLSDDVPRDCGEDRGVRLSASLKWESTERFMSSLRRIQARFEALELAARDAQLRSTREPSEAYTVHFLGRNLGVGTPHADEVLRECNV